MGRLLSKTAHFNFGILNQHSLAVIYQDVFRSACSSTIRGQLRKQKNLNELAKGFSYQKQQKKISSRSNTPCLHQFRFHFSSTKVQQVLEECELKLLNLDSQCDIQ